MEFALEDNKETAGGGIKINFLSLESESRDLIHANVSQSIQLILMERFEQTNAQETFTYEFVLLNIDLPDVLGNPPALETGNPTGAQTGVLGQTFALEEDALIAEICSLNQSDRLSIGNFLAHSPRNHNVYLLDGLEPVNNNLLVLILFLSELMDECPDLPITDSFEEIQSPQLDKNHTFSFLEFAYFPLWVEIISVHLLADPLSTSSSVGGDTCV